MSNYVQQYPQATQIYWSPTGQIIIDWMLNTNPTCCKTSPIHGVIWSLEGFFEIDDLPPHPIDEESEVPIN